MSPRSAPTGGVQRMLIGRFIEWLADPESQYTLLDENGRPVEPLEVLDDFFLSL